MTHRVPSVLLVVALVSASGVPAAHVRQGRPLRQRQLVRVNEPEAVHLQGYALGTNTLVDNRHRHRLVTVADVRPSVRVGAMSALVEVREAGVVLELPGQPVPVAANTRPTRPSHVVLSARAPPA